MMKAESKRFLAVTMTLALLLAHVPVLAAPTSARLTGRVFEKDLVAPATNLTVQMFPDGAKVPVASTSTDQQGRFELTGIPAGSYVLLLSGPGGPLAATRVTTKAGEKQAITLALPQEKTEQGTTTQQEERKKKGAGWWSSPTGATLTVVAAAIVLAVGAHEITKSDNETQPPPVSPVGR